MPMKKKTETPLQGYLSSIVAFIIATAMGILVFSIASHHAADQLAQKKLTSNISRQSIHFEEILNVNYSFWTVLPHRSEQRANSSLKKTKTCFQPSSPPRLSTM